MRDTKPTLANASLFVYQMADFLALIGRLNEKKKFYSFIS